MDTQLCKEFIKIIPQAAALFIANSGDRYKLVECNPIFSSIFNLDGINASDVISSIHANDTFLSRSIIRGIHDIVKKEKSESVQELSDYNIVLNKVNLDGREYLIILLLSVVKEMQSTIKNYESFYNAIDDMFLVGNWDGTILFSNNAVTKKLGYSKEELKSMHMLALHPKEKREEAEEILADMLKHKRDVCPLPLMKKNGRHLPVETRIWFGEWDGEERIFSISKDLSAEQGALQKFTKLFDYNPACIAIISLETGLYSRVNKAFLKTFGFSEDEVIGKAAAELGIIADAEIYNELKEELLSKGFFKDKIIKVRRKTGEIIIGLISGEIVESQGERLSMTTMVDLTHQTETEQKLAKESKLQEILIDLSSRYINCSLENIEDDIQVSLETVGRFVDADRVYIFDYDFQTRITRNTFEWCNDAIEPQIG